VPWPMQDSPSKGNSPNASRLDDGRAILVVDDDFVVKHLLKEWLAAAGYRCLVANSAEQGWRVIKDFAAQIWLVILDVMMPGKYDGIGLLDRIIEVAQGRSLKVIMMSSSQEHIARAVEHGCDEFMTKPIMKQLLLKKVEALKLLSKIEDQRRVELDRAAVLNSGRQLTIAKLLSFWDEARVAVFPAGCVPDCGATQVSEWGFNVFDFSEDQLLVLAKHMFVSLGLLQQCGMPEETLDEFLLEVRRGYNDNPYHNWRHAFDVTQATFVFIVKFCGPATLALTATEQLALLVAALSHDLAHPGHNNDFLIRTGSEVAMLYNNRSVLENCHSFMLFRLLDRRPAVNVLATLSKGELAMAKRTIIETILATDPATHNDYVARFAAVERDALGQPAQRLLTMQCILKMADISNVAREWDGPGYSWSCLVSQEFFNQGDAMRQYSMEVAPFLDRNATTIGRNSISFIDHVAMPLFVALGKLFPEFERHVVSVLAANRTRWDEESSKM
jgi:CheY-like chemotaxis protein